MVLTKHGKMLYDGVVDLVIQNLDRLANEFIIPAFPPTLSNVEPAQRAQSDAQLLRSLTRVWEDHRGSMEKIGSILKYLVRSLLSSRSLYTMPTHAMPLRDTSDPPKQITNRYGEIYLGWQGNLITPCKCRLTACCAQPC